MIQLRDLIKHIRFGVGSTIGKNIISLYLLLVSYYILPLITVPYLVRVLGPEKFGLVAFGQSLLTFFVLFVNYGFDLTATREISIKRESDEDVSRISCSVWIAKALLALIGFAVLIVLIMFVEKMKQNSKLLVILFGIAIGNMLFPNWLFLGLERMKAISVINILMRLFTTLSIFILIKNPNDYLLYAGLLSFQWIFAGISGVCFAIARLKIRITIPEAREIANVMSVGWRLFVSNIAQSIYLSGNSFILGFLTTDYSVVGYYSAAEKIILSLVGIFRPIAQSVYPRFSQMAISSRNSVLLWGRRLIYVMGGVGMIASITILFGAHIIINVFLGSGYYPSIAVLKILSVIPFIMALCDVLSNQIMLPFNKDSFYAIIRVFTATLHVVLALLLVPRFQEKGIALVFVLSQTFILVTTFLFLWYWELTPMHYKVDKKISKTLIDSGN